MRILYLMDQMRLHGGAERIVAHKINHLATNDGHEVHLLTTEQKNQPFVYTINPKIKHHDLGIDYVRGKSYFHPANLGKLATHLLKLKRYISRIKPDIIVSVSYSPEQYFLPKIARNIPKVKEFHSSGWVMVPGSRKQKLERFFLGYDALVVLNESEKQYYPDTQIEVIPNFTDFEPVTEILPREKTVLAAGRIAPVKQFDKLIDIWKKVSSHFPDWQLKIFGDGEPADIEMLKKQIIASGLSDSASINAPVASLRGELLKSSVYAMTSKTECFPMILLEAQASGVPIVSYACPNGPQHIVSDNRNGFLVEAENPSAFAKKLSELMQDDQLRTKFGQSSAQDVNQFRRETVMQQWNALFSRLKK